MKPEEQRRVVIDYLEERDRIAGKTKEKIKELSKVGSEESELLQVDPELRQIVEDEYYENQGKQRYTTSDGRTTWLSPTDHERRSSRRQKRASRYYGPTQLNRAMTIKWTFNILAIVLAMGIVYIILS